MPSGFDLTSMSLPPQRGQVGIIERVENFLPHSRHSTRIASDLGLPANFFHPFLISDNTPSTFLRPADFFGFLFRVERRPKNKGPLIGFAFPGILNPALLAFE